MLVLAVVSAQPQPTTGYAPVNGVKMYYEVHGSGEPVVLLHGAFMSITNNWEGWIGELAKTRKVMMVTFAEICVYERSKWYRVRSSKQEHKIS
jgi:pimeloyl-ACP methyl ester carboxylesterase